MKKTWRVELKPAHPTDLFPNKKVSENKSSFHTPAHKEEDLLRDERVGRIILPNWNLTFNSLNVLLDLAKEPVCPMEQQGVLPRLCQVCCSPAEQPSPWLAADLRRSGWFHSLGKKEVVGMLGEKKKWRITITYIGWGSAFYLKTVLVRKAQT